MGTGTLFKNATEMLMYYSICSGTIVYLIVTIVMDIIALIIYISAAFTSAQDAAAQVR